jgi:hypothetical protein
MNFFTKASLTAGIVLSSVFISAVNASAAVFNFTFDNTFDSTLTPPFVGSGTLGFDGAATVGSYSLASLSNLNMNFSFTNGSSFSLADSISDFSTSGISIFDLGSGNLGLVFTGSNPLASMRFIKNSDNLSFEPTISISNPTGCCGGNGVTNLYTNGSSVLGSYNAVSAAQQVPEPTTVLGSLAAFAYAAHSKRKSNLDRSTAKKEFGE